MPGLYFIGEVVDVTGWLGGYNFQWAWSCGPIAPANSRSTEAPLWSPFIYNQRLVLCLSI